MKKIIAKQIHSSIVQKVNRHTHSWGHYDGMTTDDLSVALVAYGADCALIAFWDDKQIGVCHAGWRGLIDGIIQNVLNNFTITVQCHIAPFLHEFEIQQDSCYKLIREKFGDRYFRYEETKIIFEFKRAVLHSIESIPYTIDDRSTINHPTLASFRRDKKKGNGTQNRLAIWRDHTDTVQTKLFYPKEEIVLWHP
jgi:copper oxidase (laccase) domain-containing protein